MLNSVLQRLSILTIGFSVASTSSAFVTQSQQASSRTIVVDLKNVTGRRIVSSTCRLGPIIQISNSPSCG